MMETLMESSAKALRSLGAPGMPSILLQSLLISIVALTGFFFAVSSFFFWLFGASSMLAWLGAFGAGLFAWFLFPAIMPVIVNFFDTRIVRLIEARDYPGAPRAGEPPFLKEFLHDVRFTGKALLLNLLVLPLYLIPVVNLIVFYGLNGYLLGREFFVMVARQHMPIAQALALHKNHKRLATIGGASLAVAATIPIVNLFAPIWGIALMVHLYHRVDKSMLALPPKAEIIL